MANQPQKKKDSGSPMQDPFYVVKEEVLQSMQGITALHERWRDLLYSSNTASNEEFKFLINELKTGLKTIEYDLTDLEDTVKVVESNRTKFKIEDSEINTRKAFIETTKQKVNSIKEELNSTKTRGKMEKDQRDLLAASQRKPVSDKYSKLQGALEQDNDNFIADQQKRQTQIIKQQDDNVTILHDTVRTLHQMGNQIDKTIKEQETLIEDLDRDVTRVDSGLRGAIKKVNQLIDSTKDSTQWCIIAFLFVVLVGLLVAVFMIPSRNKSDGGSSGDTTTTG